METVVTADLSDFGYRELRLAVELLNAYKTSNDNTRLMGDGLSLCMNTNSGYVFLTDEDYNVAMMNGHVLEDWHTCPECGHEGFAEDLDDEHHLNDDGWIEHGPAEDEEGDEPTYSIVRHHFKGEREVIQTGLTLEEAQEHCQREDTHGGSTDDGTAWFDGYTEE